ncbi:TonB-dependent receptor [Novosphingobium cyanobacteriorum]|uniref:TonB-dependent receptor n=1 Tax=Novosphingobium cyanobacteriorum TaxID=3024215 RepID=A0ABT6CIS4_9SPHN|nr:TonB-dependent receptor [Novosphingobium cyanobacteriorum]MDF8333717.1 TonB-dependent receptor [Novosphingobium cyanobacteriorum]
MNRIRSAAGKAAYLISAAAVAFAAQAHAQDVPQQEAAQAGSAEAGLADAIVVTANKRSESLQKVSISVSAFSGDQIKRLNITDTTQITQQIPSLRVNAWSPNLTIFSLRGISQNNFTDNLEAPVAVYQDNAYIASMNAIAGQLFDIKRVEVLRGPQGTLFGRNATGGLIHYLSNDASKDAFEGYASGEYGRFHSWSIEGAAGGALAQGVRLRVAGRMEKADGYIKSRDTFDPTGALIAPGSGQDLGGRNGWAARANLQFDITPEATLSLWYKHAEDNNVATGGYVFENCVYLANGYCNTNAAGLSDDQNGVINGVTSEKASPWVHFGERPGRLDRVMNSYQGQLDWKLGGAELTSITNYLTMNKVYAEDGDALPFTIVNVDSRVKFHQFSQELRLAGETGMLKWQVGGYYLDMKYNGSHAVTGAPILDLAIAGNGGFSLPTVDQRYLINSKNWSVFAQGDIKFNDKLSLTLGGRYSKDNKSIDYRNILSDPTYAPQPDPKLLFTDQDLAAVVPGVNRDHYGDWAARVSLNYQATPDALLFLSWNRGIKGGNWSLSSNIAAQDFRHRPETLNSIEGGFKTTLLGGKLRLNGTVYHYIYDDYQAFSLAGGVPKVYNSDARATGAELEAFWSPSRNFDAVFGATYEHSRVDSIPGTGVQFGPELFPGAPDSEYCKNLGGVFRCDFPQANIKNAQLPNAPKFSFNYLLRYNRDVSGGNIAAQVDGVWYDDQFLEVTNGLGSLQKAYNVTNLSLTYKHDQTGIALTAWAHNVFNKAYRAYALNLGILGVTSIYAPPVTYGATLRIPFGANRWHRPGGGTQPRRLRVCSGHRRAGVPSPGDEGS